MNRDSRCFGCGKELSGPAAHQGFCPQCLLQQAASAAPEAVEEEPVAVSLEPMLRPFGPYDLLEEIGRGGMGVVYKARQRSLDRLVAVKMLAPGVAANPEYTKRLRAEATAAACLQHPRIVAIHQVGVHEGQHYFAMDYIAGQSLARVAGGRPLPPRAAARYLQQIAEAVHYAHEHGILHRDLKPSNVLIDQEDQPHVTDFGLARRLEGDLEITMTGQVLGSPPYMPPEQVQGRKGRLSRRTDVYGLGAMLYHLLTGRPPFVAEELAAIIELVLNSEPLAPRQLNRSVPRDLETICLKCLEKDPNRRFATARELAEELGRFLASEPIKTHPIGWPGRSWRWCRRKPALAGALITCCLLLVAGVAGISIQWRRADRALADATAQRHTAEMRLARMQISEGWRRYEVGDTFAALDSFQQAYALDQEEPGRAAVHQTRLGWLFQDSPKPIRSWWLGGPANHVELSADHRWLAVALAITNAPANTPLGAPWAPVVESRGVAQVWDLSSFSPVSPILAHPAPVTCVAFDPAHPRLATTAADGSIRLWALPGGEPLGKPLQSPVPGALGLVRFSSDGMRLVCGNKPNTTAENGVLMLWDISTRQCLWTNIELGMRLRDISVTPDGSEVLAASRSYLGVRFNAKSGTISGSITNCWDIRDVAYSSDQRMAALAGAFGPGGENRGARIYETKSWRPVSPFLSHIGCGLCADISADDTRVVVGSIDYAARVWDVQTGRALTHPLDHRAPVNSVAFCPFGDCVATGCADASARVWEVATGKPLSPPLPHDTPVLKVAFVAEGKALLTITESGLAVVWSLRPSTVGREVLQHSQLEIKPAYEPYGILAHSNRLILASEDNFQASFINLDENCRVATLNNVLHTAHANVCTNGYSAALLDRLYDFDAPGNPLRSTPFLSDRIYFFDAPHPSVLLGYYPESRKSVLVDTATGKVLHDLGNGRSGCTCYAPLLHVLFTYSPEAGACLWFPYPPGRVVLPVDKGVQLMHSSFSPDGTLVALAANNGNVMVFHTRDQSPAFGPLLHSGEVSRVAFSSDGERIITACGDRTLRVWSPRSGRALLPPIEHPAAVKCAASSPNGSLLVSGSADGMARLWDPITGEPVSPPLPHESVVINVSFSPDGRRLLTVGSTQTGRLWDLPENAGSPAHWSVLANLLTSGGKGLSPLEICSAWDRIRASAPNAFRFTSADAETWEQFQAWEAMKRSDWSDALLHWDRSLANRSNAWECVWPRGQVLMQLAKSTPSASSAYAERAIQDLVFALRLQPRHLEVWRDLSRALELCSNPESSAETILPLVHDANNQPCQPLAVLPKALVLLRLHRYSEVVAMLSPLQDQKPSVGEPCQVFFVLSMAQHELGLKEDALRTFQAGNIPQYHHESKRLWREAAAKLDVNLQTR